MSNDNEIYNSEEYKARIERARRSLESFRSESEAISTAAESIAYWQMRTVKAESFLHEEGYLGFGNKSNRNEM